MYYKDKKYFLAIQDYKRGNNTNVISILKMLAKKNLTKFDDDLSLRELNDNIERDAQVQMAKFSEKLIEQIKFGIIPPIRFNTTVKEGVPEDIISEFAKQTRPYMIVMGTRGSGKKEKELIGSVTGEVLDSCRFPVFAVPESANIFDIKKLNQFIYYDNTYYKRKQKRNLWKHTY